jgi:energy-coupling factor transporter ATP-binding protein EcfA2
MNSSQTGYHEIRQGPIDQVVNRLDHVTKRGRGYIARCPAHDDGRPSLKIDSGDDGRVLLHCYAGCDYESILAAIDLRAVDLFEPKPSARLVRPAPPDDVTHVYDYLAADGTLAFQVVRKPGKEFLQRRPKGTGGWVWNLDGVERPLYHQPELIAEPRRWVHIPEGEKDADRLRKLGMLATTAAGGASAPWLDSYTETLRGHAGVVILPDNDKPGRDYAERKAAALYSGGIRVKVVHLPGLPPGGDVSDWLDAGHTKDELIRLAKAAPDWTPNAEPTEATATNDDVPQARKKSLSDQLIAIIEAQPGVAFWHDASDDPYITLERSGHAEHHQIDSASFRKLAAHLLYCEIGRSIAGASLQQALEALQGRALFDGKQHIACRRIGITEDAIWLDPCRDDWQVWRITADGWQLVPSDVADVRFMRTRGQLSLPDPVPGGDLESLRRLFTLSDDGWLFVRAFLISNFQARGERPVLELTGSEGSGKTTLMRALISIFDPNEGAIQRSPKDPADWFVAAKHRTALALDNLSSISGETSNTICTISSGITMPKRALFTDADESALRAYASIAYTSIAPLSAFRPDLVSRTLPVEVSPVEEVRPSQEVHARIEECRPEWLGALLDALVMALRRRDEVTETLANLPRLADLAILVEAAGPALNIVPGAFVAAVHEAKAQADVSTLDHFPVTGELIRMIDDQPGHSWQGTVSDLLTTLVASAPLDLRNAPGWPRQANALSAQLRRLAKALRTSGIDVSFTRSRAATLATIRRIDPPPAPPENVTRLRRQETPAAYQPTGTEDRRAY